MEADLNCLIFLQLKEQAMNSQKLAYLQNLLPQAPTINNNIQPSQPQSQLSKWKKFANKRSELKIAQHRERFTETCNKKLPSEELMKELGTILQSRSQKRSATQYGVMPKPETNDTGVD